MKQGVKNTLGDSIYNDDTYQQITSTMSKNKLFSTEEIKKISTLERGFVGKKNNIKIINFFFHLHCLIIVVNV